MANVLFKKGLLSALPSTYSEGTIYVTTDERAMYLDISGSERIRLGDFIEVANIDALPTSGANQSALYYATSENVLAKWNGTKWVQINPDNYYQLNSIATALSETSVTVNGNAKDAIQVETTTTEKDESGNVTRTIATNFKVVEGNSNVTIEAGDNNSIIISTANDTVSDAAHHYTPATDSTKDLDVTAKKVISAINRDSKGHITGIEERAENEVTAAPVTVTGGSNNSALITNGVQTSGGADVKGNHSIAAAGDLTLGVNADSRTITITGHDTKVTSAENHYKYDATRDGAAVAVTATTDTSNTNTFVTGITKDAAGHIVGITTKDVATAVNLEFVEASSNNVALRTNINGVQADSDMIKGAGGTTVSVATGGVLTITSTDSKVTSAENHYGYDTDRAGTISATTGTATGALAETDVVSGVTIDAAGHVTGVTSKTIADTHANVSSVSAAGSASGWTIQVEDTDGKKAAGTLALNVNYGKNGSTDAAAANGEVTLDVYTIAEADAKFTELFNSTKSMVLKGEIAADNTALGNANTQAGDTYIVTSSITQFGQECEAGDLFIAKKDGAGTTTAADWYYVPSGDDKHILKAYNDGNLVGVQLCDGNDEVNGPIYGVFNFDNSKSDSLIKVTATANTTGVDSGYGQNVSFAINMEWGSF